MLRQSVFSYYLIIAVLLVSGTAFSQRAASTEVTVTKCWEFPAENIISLTTNGRDIFAAADGGRVLAVSAKGEKLWQTDLGGEVVPEIKVESGMIVVTTRSGAGLTTANRLSSATGLPASGSGDPGPSAATGRDTNAHASAGDVVVLGNDAGLVTSLAGSGPVWKFKTGGAISAVIPDGDKFIVISRDNFVYALHARNGALDWKRRTQGRIGHYGVGKGFLFVSALDQHGGTFIDLLTGRVAGQLVIAADDQVVTDPAVIDDSFVVATSTGLSRYSLSGCAAK